MIQLRKSTPRWMIFLMDVCISVFSLLLAYAIRFDIVNIPFDKQRDIFLTALPVFLLVKIATILLFQIHKGLVRFTSLQDAKRILFASLSATALFFLASILRYSFVDGKVFLPTGVIVVEFLVSFFIMIFIRFTVKVLYHESVKGKSEREKILIYGAGVSGRITKKTLENDTNRTVEVLGFIDDDKSLKGKRIEGVVVHHSDNIDALLQKANSLIVSIQKPNLENKRKVIDSAIQKGLQVLEVPSVDSWINGELSSKQLKKVKIEDLLGRKPIQLDDEVLSKELNEKVILVSGAAGSIGSGIVNELLQFSPKKVLLLDQAESPMYDLVTELKAKMPNCNVEEIIGDIRNVERMRNVFRTFKPQIVFHAAAYKHVPLMEDNPTEAILTNVKGTRNLVDLADEFQVEKFVMVSTDKAVNPTNVMGASKRIAEIYAQSKGLNSSTKYVTTRFGNVLGSNGSVIPLFRKQIEKGGPVTVTDERITRFFMTIPEACRLVLEAGTMGNGGEVYVFDMGEPVKIIDLAHKMIYLSGLELGKDIEIKITGLRPGEKLYEELLNDEEQTQPTHHPQILIAKQSSDGNLLDEISELIHLFEAQDNDAVVKKMKQIVPEFKSNNSIFSKFD